MEDLLASPVWTGSEIDRRVLGARIRWCREAAGLSQVGLAREVAVSKVTMNRAEQGTQLLEFRTLVHVAVVLGVTLDDLVPLPRVDLSG